ncbi:MAG: hypothetical protein ORN52_11375 [Beijerinckiaceae bacterium]|nr:hypothetical protein [Beijerinckiaceae bacterium]
MNYLLVGNGPTKNLARAADAADSIVQINHCRHAEHLSAEKTQHVFIANMGETVSAPLCQAIKERGALLGEATIIRGRNPVFYTSKSVYLQTQSLGVSLHDYRLTQSWRMLAKIWPIKSVSLLSSVRLKYQMLRLGMPQASMPSTGMIAYDWLLRKLKPNDRLTVEGFTFEGWPGHPWAIERDLILPIGAAPSQI